MNVPRVSVVIPAYGAERWIRDTIVSVQNQTVSDIEIIVAVDGSTDRTLETARALAVNDSRIVVLELPNGGVARARNAGIAASRSPFVAPIDADDLWHPRRLELHLEALSNAPVDCAVAYSPYVEIDEEGTAIRASQFSPEEGDVFGALLGKNFVGNGSALLVRREALDAVGHYEPALRDGGAEGCEDYLLQLKLACLYKYVCVPYRLIGYRKSPGAMSTQMMQMWRSRLAALAEAERFASSVHSAAFWIPRALTAIELSLGHVKALRYRQALSIWAKELARNPLVLPYSGIMVFTKVGRLSVRPLRVLRRISPISGMPYQQLDVFTLPPKSYGFWTAVLIRWQRWLADRLRNSNSAPKTISLEDSSCPKA